MAVFDDIHWAEPGLLDLIEHIAEWTRDAPILLLCLARPDLQDVRPGWGGQASATTLHLDPLSEDESDQLIVGLLGRSDAPAAVSARVTEAAEGNPLFVEQMVAMLIDDGLIRPEADGWVVTGDLSNLTVPPTIAGLLQARLDRLTPEEQRVIERGSVEGRVFHWGSVTELSSDLAPGDVGRHLMALHRRDLIGPEQALFGGSEAFRFRHALIRDAAYERIPKRTAIGVARGARALAGARRGRTAPRVRGGARLPPGAGRGAQVRSRAARRARPGARGRGGRSTRGGWAPGDRPRRPSRGQQAPGSGGRPAGSGRSTEDRPSGTSRNGGDQRRGSGASEVGTRGSPRRASHGLDDRGLEIRARLAHLAVLWQMAPEGVTEQLEHEAKAAIPVLEELGDDEGLARAWSSRCEVALMRCHASDIETASEHAAFHAERAGDRAALFVRGPLAARRAGERDGSARGRDQAV